MIYTIIGTVLKYKKALVFEANLQLILIEQSSLINFFIVIYFMMFL